MIASCQGCQRRQEWCGKGHHNEVLCLPDHSGCHSIAFWRPANGFTWFGVWRCADGWFQYRRCPVRALIRWDEKAGLQRDAIRSQCSTCSRHKKRRPAMEKISTVQVFGNEIWKEQKLTIGVDLGDRWSFYCVLDEAGKIILEQKVTTTPEAMKQTFGKMPRSLIALETGTHSPWASRLLTELGHEVIVAHAQKVEF